MIARKMIHPIKQENMIVLAKYQRELWQSPQLRYLYFELTDRCNLACLHCGSKCTGNNNTVLDPDIIEKTLRSVAAHYNPAEIMICLTGGEPLLYPQLIRIVRTAHNLGFAVGITSNGTLIDESAAKQLSEAGLDTIAISLDGIGETHDELRQVPGSYDKAWEGIRALRSAAIEPQILTVVHKRNLFQLDSLYQILEASDIYSWRIVNLEPIGRAVHQQELLLDGKDLRTLLSFIREKRFNKEVRMEVTYGCSHFVTYEFEKEIRDFYFQCGAGTLVAGITANGDIGGCLDIERRRELVQGNIYKDEFVHIWEERFAAFRKDRSAESAICKDCEHRIVCMGDSAHTWNYAANEPNYCVARKLTEAE